MRLLKQINNLRFKFGLCAVSAYPYHVCVTFRKGFGISGIFVLDILFAHWIVTFVHTDHFSVIFLGISSPILVLLVLCSWSCCESTLKYLCRMLSNFHQAITELFFLVSLIQEQITANGFEMVLMENGSLFFSFRTCLDLPK